MQHASNPQVAAYIAGVLGGSVPINELARLSVERHVADLDRWPAATRAEAVAIGSPFWFDEVAAQYRLDFSPLCVHVEGELAGEPFAPLPYQAFVDWVSFGWMDVSTGARRFHERFIEEPRGNGKSFWMAVDGDFMLVADGEAGAKVYAIATKEGQAAEAVWGAAAEIAKQSPALIGTLEVQESVNNRKVFVPGTNARFVPLPSDQSKADSLNPHAVYLDEIHEWKNRLLYTKLKTAMGKRLQAMLTGITTAADDRPNTIYEELHEHAIRVLRGWQDGSFVDEEFFAIIFCVDSKADGCAEDDDAFDEVVWHKANPALGATGTSVRIGHLRSMANRAKAEPEVLRDFLRLHLGRRVSAKIKPITDEAWKACAASEADGPIGEQLAARDWSAFDGRPAFAALDLSSTRDLTALTLYFPPFEGWAFDTYLFRAWLPKENLRSVCERDRAPYDHWAREGWLLLTEGDEVDDQAVFDEAIAINERYIVVQWAYDPWHATSLKNRFFAATGIEMVKFVQDLPSFGEPTREFLDAVAGRKMRHDGNPLARWCAANVVTKEDAHGNKRPHKQLSHNRIDSIVAAIMARGRAIVVPVPTAPPAQPWNGVIETW